ncbi:LuxR C-terminal-related transcriptional regulator [soil metagenome]
MSSVDIERILEGTGSDRRSFAAAAHETLSRLFDLDVVVLASVDPASGLETSCDIAGVPQDADRELRIFELEWFAEEPLRYHELAHAPVPAGALRLTTDPKRVRRYVEIFEPHGGYDELRLACVADGTWWGTVSGYRMVGKPAFTPEEVGRAAGLSEVIARGLRKVFLRSAVEEPGRLESPPGAFVIDMEGRQVTTSESAETLLSAMSTERVETVSRALATSVARSGTTTITISDDGGTLAFHAEPVKGADEEISVIVENPRPIELTPFIVAAYQLSPRERQVAELVLDGLLTKQISRRLRISEYTVQDHLKSIFTKTDTATLGELCAALFTRFYRPHYDEGVSPGPYGFFLVE